MILIAASNRDVASLNIKRQLLNYYEFKKTNEGSCENPTHKISVGGKKVQLVTMNEESVFAQDLSSRFTDIELAVFVSRHSSESGKPTLSVHTPGNLDEARLGGLPRRVSISPANAMRNALKAMMRLKAEQAIDYEVCYECTHHGPSLDVPVMFAELGSTREQWNDMEAAGVVAHASMEAISRFNNCSARTVLGIGGPHYNAKFTRIALEKEVAFGHIIPKHAIPHTDAEIITQCVKKTMERVECAVLDWKGIKGEDKATLVRTLEKVGLPYERI